MAAENDSDPTVDANTDGGASQPPSASLPDGAGGLANNGNENQHDISQPTSTSEHIKAVRDVVDERAASSTPERSKLLPPAESQTLYAPPGARIFSHEDGWLDEILASISSILAFAAFLAVLVYFNGCKIPELGHGLTLNGLISVLTTIIRLSLALCLSTPLGQLKWLWMADERRPLSDIATFDEATRGPIGASSMLFKFRGGLVALMGAFLILIVPGFGFTMQQAVQYPTVHVASRTQNASIVNSGVGTTLNTLAPGFEDPALIAAVYDGIFGDAFVSAPRSIPFFCPSGNCTWDGLESVGVCSFCSNITDHLTAFGNYSALCNASVATYDPSVCGPEVQNAAVSWLQNAPLYQIYTGRKSVAFPYLPSYILSVFVIENNQPPGPLAALYPPPEQTWATKCALQYCLETYDVAVIGGNLQRNLTNISKSWFGNLTLQENKGILPDISDTLSAILQRNITGDNESSGPVANRFYALGEPAALILNLTAAIGVWLSTAGDARFNLVNGTVWVEEVHVHVVWPWITLPALLVLCSPVFLALTIFLSRQRSKTQRHLGIWKNDALALLFHGLDNDTRVSLPAGVKKRDISVSAEKTWVQLVGEHDLKSWLRGERKAGLDFKDTKVHYRKTF
ncbi:hypothetical protein PV04_08793 [Phialophora macrospora]|uniref:Uncharacterized protein n=1 Tax=Phialophora macrospora TaxID=1851006 RepID=A0A0D2CFA8_9EURO|nr:hypothetical protein PV04_08793 [Phialophora macrospora]